MTQSVIQLQKSQPSGWSVGMFLVPLGDGRLLVHSPTRLGPKTWETVEKHGQPAVLFAPNHYHHLGLPSYRERYPEARVVAASKARPRLAEQGNREIEAIEDLPEDALPEGFRFLVCEGVKTGETFLSIPGDGGRTWIVCDAFFNVPGPTKGFMGFVLRMLATAPGLAIGRTFWLLALKNTKAYLTWLEEKLAEERPTRVLFSHGQPLEGEDVPERLLELAKRRLG